MSVDRRNDRRANRIAHSSPYARPTKHSKQVPTKKSVSIRAMLSSATLFDTVCLSYGAFPV
jgi:hypothetical protein